MEYHVFGTGEAARIGGSTKYAIVKDQKVYEPSRSRGRLAKQVEVRRNGVLSLTNEGDDDRQAVFLRWRLVKAWQETPRIAIFILMKERYIKEDNGDDQARQSRRGCWRYRDDGLRTTGRTVIILIVSFHDSNNKSDR